VFLNESKNLIQNLNDISTQIKFLIEQTTNQENNIGRLLYDKESIEKLKVSIERIDVITKILTEQLGDKGIKVDAKIRLFK